jgi:PTH1 family peptidyl-tRNA hydrolase
MIFFGLGNPGRKYERTRHNLGFMVLERLAHDFGTRFENRDATVFAAKTGGVPIFYQEAAIQLGGLACRLVKPLTYMNNSGLVVKDVTSRSNDDFLVVCDDLALPFGRMRIRTRGSEGGHQGLASVIFHLATTNFPRVRMGIGAPPGGVDATDHVLAEFLPEEREHLPAIVNAGSDALVTIGEQGLTTAMNEFNRRHLLDRTDRTI